MANKLLSDSMNTIYPVPTLQDVSFNLIPQLRRRTSRSPILLYVNLFQIIYGKHYIIVLRTKWLQMDQPLWHIVDAPFTCTNHLSLLDLRCLDCLGAPGPPIFISILWNSIEDQKQFKHDIEHIVFESCMLIILWFHIDPLLCSHLQTVFMDHVKRVFDRLCPYYN